MIGWQDARTAPDCERLREYEPLIRARTGLALDPMFSATKLHRLLDGRDDLHAGTIDAFLSTASPASSRSRPATPRARC